MYAGASAVGALESLVAGRPTSSPIPIVIAFIFAALLWRYGHRVDRRVLFVLGPIGALLVGGAIATSPPGDGAVMYAWPVLWIASFFGTAETVVVLLARRRRAGGRRPAHAGRELRPLVRRHDLVRGHRRRRADAGRAQPAAGRAPDGRVAHRPADRAAQPPRAGRALRAELARAAREERPLSVVAIDIDHFKRINDTHGHDAGDRALVRLASTLSEQTRGADITARVGGEEFPIAPPRHRRRARPRVRRALAAWSR